MDREQSEFERLLRLATRKLGVREHSIGEIRQYLLRKLANRDEYPLIDRVIDRLIALDLLDDRRFTSLFIQSRKNRGKGPKIIQLELQQRQVSEEIIKSELAAIETEVWVETARRVARKKYYQMSAAEGNIPMLKLRQSLFARGFDYQVIKAVVDDLTLRRVE